MSIAIERPRFMMNPRRAGRRRGVVASLLALTLAASAQAQPAKPPVAQPAEPPVAQPAKPPVAQPVEPTRLVVADEPITSAEVPSHQLLHTTGRVVLRVGSEDEAVRAIESRLQQLGGQVVLREGRRLRARVPRDAFDRALLSVVGVGVELRRSVNVVDTTERYLELLARLRTAELARNRVARLHGNVSGVKDPLRVEGALARADELVASLRRQLHEVLRASELATLEISLDPTRGRITEELPKFELPFPWLADVGPERLSNLSRTPAQDRARGTIESAVQMDLRLEAMRAGNERVLGANETAVAAGFALRGVGDTTPIGFAAGMDWKLGGGMSGGFLYDLRLLAGLGTAAGRFFSLGVVSGAGIGGVTGDHIPFGVEIPVEGFAGFELGDYARATAWARTSWILASDDRQEGSEIAPFGDEFASGLSLLVGGLHGSYSRERVGLVLAGAYRELLGTHAYEISLGYGVSFLDFDGE